MDTSFNGCRYFQSCKYMPPPDKRWIWHSFDLGDVQTENCYKNNPRKQTDMVVWLCYP